MWLKNQPIFMTFIITILLAFVRGESAGILVRQWGVWSQKKFENHWYKQKSLGLLWIKVSRLIMKYKP